jgi:hypothetical protein
MSNLNSNPCLLQSFDSSGLTLITTSNHVASHLCHLGNCRDPLTSNTHKMQA